MAKVVAVGDNVVDCYAALGEMFPGGNCVNVSVFASRFGAQTAYVGALANDPAGWVIRNALANEHVATARLRVLSGDTAHCMIGHHAGDRTFLSADLGVSMFVPQEQDFTYVGAFDSVHIGKSSGLDDFVKRFAEKALLSYDFSEKLAHPRFDEIASRCFLASFSGGSLADQEILVLLQRALTAGSKWALVTKGRRGALLACADAMFSVAAHPCDVVDTLGAGDTFIAGTLVGLLENREPPDSFLASAARAAAETCTHYGAIGHGALIKLKSITS